MPVKNVSIDEASDEQLRLYASHFLQIELNGEDPRTVINRAQPGASMIFYLEDEPVTGTAADAETPHQEGGMVGSLGRGDPKWTINIPIVESEDNSGKNDVTVGVNGRAWQIKRGVDVAVPHRVVLALEGAIADQVRHNPETGDVEVRQVKRFPYQTLDRPSAEAIKAWEEATQNEFCA